MQTKILTPEIAQQLDRLCAAAARQIGPGAGEFYFYLQVEKGEVRQIGVSPVPGQTIKLPDNGRRKTR